MSSRINFQQVTLFDVVEKYLLRPQQFIIGFKAGTSSAGVRNTVDWPGLLREPAIACCSPNSGLDFRAQRWRRLEQVLRSGGYMWSDWAMGHSHHCGSIGVNQFGSLNRATAAHGTIRRDGGAGKAGMSWKIEVIVDDSGEWEGDPLRFESEREALAYARDLEFRWSAIRDKRVVKSEDPVNCSWPRYRLHPERLMP